MPSRLMFGQNETSCGASVGAASSAAIIAFNGRAIPGMWKAEESAISDRAGRSIPDPHQRRELAGHRAAPPDIKTGTETATTHVR
jgi:hypothetical protein